MQISRLKTGREKEENFVEQLISKYLPYWPIFVIAAIVGLGIGFTYLRYATPIYEATATLIVKDEKKGNEESKLVESLDQISSKKIVENEIEVIQSRKLMEDVVRALGLYAPIYQKGEVRNTLAYTTSPVSIVAIYPDSLNFVDKIDINYDQAKQEVLLNHRYKYQLNEIVQTPFGLLKFSQNKYYEQYQSSKRVEQFYFSLFQPKDIVPSFLMSLKAEPSSKLSSIVDLSFRDINPVRAENILNELINRYQQSAIDEKDALAKNTMSFVNDRLQIVAHDLDSIEKKIQQYKASNRAVDISTQGQLFLQNVSANDQKLGDVNTQLAALDQVENFVKSSDKTKGGIVPSTIGVNDPTLSQLVDKLYNSELEYDKLKKTVGENNPSLIAIRDQVINLKPSILKNIQSQRQNLTATKENITATNGTYNSILQGVPQKERQLLDISREQQIKSNLYAFLLQKREESEIAYASAVSDSKVIDYAQADIDPVSPKKILIYLISVMLCVGICLAIIMVRESLTGKVLYRQEVESRTCIPIIGEIAHDKSKIPLVIESGKRSYVAEEFRKLRISLSFLGIDENHKKILVTSSISGEGKSFIAANLAVSLSLTGKKVVIVDLDLNNPSVSKVLKVDQVDGMTEFLNGEKEPEEIIKRVKAHENLFFVSAGSHLPENPTELLANGKVNEILEYLDNIFDVVVVDTSPLVLVTDGYLLTGLCDATLYVIRHKYTPKVIVKRIDERNEINPLHNPAIIFNGVKIKGFFKNNYGYGYDYVYGRRKETNKKRTPTVR